MMLNNYSDYLEKLKCKTALSSRLQWIIATTFLLFFGGFSQPSLHAQVILNNDSPVCMGETITFTASTGFTNYEFFADANMNGTVEGGESLQNSASNIYTTNTLSDGDVISVITNDMSVATSAATVNEFSLPSNVLDFEDTNNGFTGSRVECSHINFYTDSWTVEGWIKRDPNDNRNTAIFTLLDGSNNSTPISVQILNTSQLQCTSGGGLVRTTTLISSGTWHHFAVVKTDNDKLQIYFDGVLEEETSGTVGDITGIHDVFLGINNSGSPRIFDGQMDDIRMWNVARTQGQITANKDIELTGSEANLVAYYNFNQGNPNQNNAGETTLIDNTGNGHNGTLVDFLLTGTSSNWSAPAPVGSSDGAALFNDGPTCAGENVTFNASPGAANYEFFLDANMNGLIDGGESLQNGTSSTYVTNTLTNGDSLSVQLTDANGCTAIVKSGVTLDDFFLPINMLDFDGVDDYVNLGNYTFYENSFTIEGWMRTPNQHNGSLVHVRDVFGGSAISIQVLPTGKLLAIIRNAPSSSGGLGLLSTTNVTDGVWHHFALVKKEDNTFDLYIDGILEASPNNIIPDFTETYEIVLGFNNTGSARFYDGQLDDLRFWSAELSAGEIVANKDRGLTGVEADLVAYYSFDQGESEGDNTGVTTLTDATANNHDGTLLNFALFGTESNWIGDQPFPQSDLIYNSSPACLGFPISFVAIPGATNYEFFLDANQNGQIDGGESLQSGSSNLYTTNIFNNGDFISIFLTDFDGCRALATSTVTVNACAANAFITQWKVSAGESVLIPVENPLFPFTYDYTVDWGDGTVDNNVTGNISHTYATGGEYYVSITGVFPHFSLRNGFDIDPDNHKRLIGLIQWGDQQWKSMRAMFEEAYNMVYYANDAPDLFDVRDCESMFKLNHKLGSPDLTNWDVSQIESFVAMFLGTNFNGNVSNWQFTNASTLQRMFMGSDFMGDVSNWNISNVTRLGGLFQSTKFNGDISNWNTTNVIDINNLFRENEVFNQDISSWDVSNVELAFNTFEDAKSFNQNISGWTFTKLVDARGMFAGATAFNQDLSNWNVSTVELMEGMFAKTTVFNSDISSWQTGNVTDMQGIFFNATSFDQNLANWNVTSLAPGLSLWEAFSGSGISPDNYDATLIGWEGQNVMNDIQVGAGGMEYCASKAARQRLMTEHGWVFVGDALADPCNNEDANAFITLWQTTADDPEIGINLNPNYDYDFTIKWGDGQMETVNTMTSPPPNNVLTHSYTDHTSLQQVEITGTFPHFIAEANDKDYNSSLDRLESKNAEQLLDVKQWGNMEWKDMGSAFRFARNLANFSATDIPNLDQVKNMSYMFDNATNFNGNLNDWNVSNVEHLSYCFHQAKKFNTDLNRWDVSKVRNLQDMFAFSKQFNQDIGNWNTINVTNMKNMFIAATAFNQDIGNWNTINVTNMRNTFGAAYVFNQDISNWNTKNVTDMYTILNNARVFNQNIGNWDLRSLTDAVGMLDNSGMDVANYDNTLIGWAAQVANLKSNITMGVRRLEYCAGASARNTLISNKNWSFIGDTECSPPNELEDTDGTIDVLVYRPDNTTLADKTLSVFPNPAKDAIDLAIQNNTEVAAKLEIRNQLGMVCWSQELEAGEQAIQVDLSQHRFPAGLYLVNLYIADEVVTEKLIVVK